MMFVGCLVAPTLMGEFFHLCLALLKQDRSYYGEGGRSNQ